MKFLAPLVICLSLNQFALSQIQTGTVVFADFTKNEITIAADSRGTSSRTGAHKDTDCKISAFGNKFVFAMAGASTLNGHWEAKSIAREVWEAQSKISSTTPLLDRVVDGWNRAMKELYSDADFIASIRPPVTGVPVIATAMFGATDDAGTLRLKTVDITFDPFLFDTQRKVQIVQNVKEVPAGQIRVMGHKEIPLEFWRGTSQRARDYDGRFNLRISNLPIDQQRAKRASKMIELSILLDPKKEELGFPIDVLQLRKGSGVRWVRRKANCPEN